MKNAGTDVIAGNLLGLRLAFDARLATTNGTYRTHGTYMTLSGPAFSLSPFTFHRSPLTAYCLLLTAYSSTLSPSLAASPL
jgi:hypothetical protein